MSAPVILDDEYFERRRIEQDLARSLRMLTHQQELLGLYWHGSGVEDEIRAEAGFRFGAIKQERSAQIAPPIVTTIRDIRPVDPVNTELERVRLPRWRVWRLRLIWWLRRRLAA